MHHRSRREVPVRSHDVLSSTLLSILATPWLSIHAAWRSIPAAPLPPSFGCASVLGGATCRDRRYWLVGSRAAGGGSGARSVGIADLEWCECRAHREHDLTEAFPHHPGASFFHS